MYINVNTTIGNTDNETITNAIKKAKEDGTNKIIIPKNNERTNSDIWVIEDTIYLPNDIEVFVDDAHLVLADDVYCNMFASQSVLAEGPRTIADEQYNITIRGSGAAKLDGGKYNGLGERNSEKDGRPHISKNTTLLFVNCRNLTIEDISITNQRWWGITNIFVRDSVFRNLCIWSDFSRFADGVHYPDEQPRHYEEVYVKNSDGIDLRVGCNNIVIENIYGFTQDDTVALTAIGAFEKHFGYYVDGKDSDIHDVKIKNITADSACSIIRLLCNCGNKLYNVDIDGVNHIKDESHIVLGTYAVRLSEKAGLYQPGAPMAKGDMHDITVRNVFSKCRYGVALYNELCNITVENVTAINGVAIAAPADEVCTVYGLKTNNLRTMEDPAKVACGEIIVK